MVLFKPSTSIAEGRGRLTIIFRLEDVWHAMSLKPTEAIGLCVGIITRQAERTTNESIR